MPTEDRDVPDKTDLIDRVAYAEFRDRLARYVYGEAPVAIEDGGQLIGFFVPAPAISPAARQAMAALEAAVAEATAAGSDEADLLRLLAPQEAAPSAPRH